MGLCEWMPAVTLPLNHRQRLSVYLMFSATPSWISQHANGDFRFRVTSVASRYTTKKLASFKDTDVHPTALNRLTVPPPLATIQPTASNTRSHALFACNVCVQQFFLVPCGLGQEELEEMCRFLRVKSLNYTKLTWYMGNYIPLQATNTLLTLKKILRAAGIILITVYVLLNFITYRVA